MARMHSRKKGKSKRKRPKSKVLPKWVKLKKAEVESIIIKLVREGTPPSKIGLILRDQYSIPCVKPLLGMPLTKFLMKKGVGPKYPEDFLQLIKKAVKMHKHLKKAKKDVHNRTKYTHVLSKILRLAKYYKRRGILPEDWKYVPEQAELLIK